MELHEELVQAIENLMGIKLTDSQKMMIIDNCPHELTSYEITLTELLERERQAIDRMMRRRGIR